MDLFSWNTLPHEKIIDSSSLIVFLDDSSNVVQMMEFFSEWVNSTVENG